MALRSAVAAAILACLVPSGAAADGQATPIAAISRLATGEIEIVEGGTVRRIGPDARAVDDGGPAAIAFGAPVLTADGRIAGWTAEIENCCTSYPIPTKLVLYRDGAVQRVAAFDAMIWDWGFQPGGDAIWAIAGTVHGPAHWCHYHLLSTETGATLDSHPCGQPGLPGWARANDPDWAAAPSSRPSRPRA
jgi:hypothetical protein